MNSLEAHLSNIIDNLEDETPDILKEPYWDEAVQWDRDQWIEYAVDATDALNQAMAALNYASEKLEDIKESYTPIAVGDSPKDAVLAYEDDNVDFGRSGDCDGHTDWDGYIYWSVDGQERRGHYWYVAGGVVLTRSYHW